MADAPSLACIVAQLSGQITVADLAAQQQATIKKLETAVSACTTTTTAGG